MEKYEIKLENGVNLKILDDNLICLYGNEYSSNYFIKIDNLLREISKKKYNDEWFIEKAILSYQAQKGKTYTFFRDDKQDDILRKYNWCQRPCSSNMSLDRFVLNGEIEGHMSESLAERYELTQVDLEEFIHKFVKIIIKENLDFKKEANSVMPIQLVLEMLEDLDRRRDVQKDIEPITGYWSKRAMLKKLLKQAGFDYSKYKKEKEGIKDE